MQAGNRYGAGEVRTGEVIAAPLRFDVVSARQFYSDFFLYSGIVGAKPEGLGGGACTAIDRRA